MAVHDKNKIAEQAKKIMDSFIDVLQKAGVSEPDFEVRRTANIRSEKAKLSLNDDFSERMLVNAPK